RRGGARRRVLAGGREVPESRVLRLYLAKARGDRGRGRGARGCRVERRARRVPAAVRRRAGSLRSESSASRVSRFGLPLRLTGLPAPKIARIPSGDRLQSRHLGGEAGGRTEKAVCGVSFSLDDLARSLAQPMPRRRALRILAGVIVAAAVPGVAE